MTFPQYPEYKDSGVEWLGEVPAHWESLRLKQVVSPDRPITYGIVQAGENVNDGIPYIRPADMLEEGGVRSLEGLLKTSLEIAESYSRSSLSSGDLVCSIGPSFGKLMVVPEELCGANLTQGTARVAIDKCHSSKYYFWVLRSPESFNQWESSIGGATFRALNLGPLSDTRVLAPPHAEQRHIAAFLDHETARIDALVEEQQRLIALLKEKRQAVISHAVTKGLDPDVPMKDSGVEWLGQVPAHWEVCKITHHLSSIVDYRGRTPEKDTSGIFLVTAKNIKNGHVDYVASEEYITEKAYHEVVKRGRPKIGDVVFTTEAPLGQVANLDRDDIALAQRVIKFRGVEGKVCNQFLKFWIMGGFCQAELESLATGSTALGIKGSKINQLSFCMPSFHEQRSIVAWISDECHRIDKLIRSAYTSMTLLEERRSALISAAVTGKIDVRGWTPPADAASAHQDTRMEAV